MSLLLSLALATSAGAAPLAWSWNVEAPVTYHVEHVTIAPRGTWYLGTENREARAVQTNLVVDMSCAATAEVRAGWDLRCDLGAVHLSGTAVPGEGEKLTAIFEEYEALFAGTSVEMFFTRSGRIRSIKLEGFERSTSRSAAVEVYMTQTITRALALLELELPKKGDDKGRWWRQGGTPLVMALRSDEGTAGGISLKHRVQAWEGDIAVFETEGRATVAYGGAMEADGTALYSVILGGQGRFDTASGTLEYREYLSQVDLTASSASALPSEHQKELGTLERIQPGDAVPVPPEAPVDEAPESVPLPVEAGGQPPVDLETGGDGAPAAPAPPAPEALPVPAPGP